MVQDRCAGRCGVTLRTDSGCVVRGGLMFCSLECMESSDREDAIADEVADMSGVVDSGVVWPELFGVNAGGELEPVAVRLSGSWLDDILDPRD